MVSLTRSVVKENAELGIRVNAGALTLLTILNNSGAQRPSVLAERVVTGASNISNVSKVTARLQQAGLVGRSGYPMDSRVSLIVLAEAGQRTREALRRSGNSLIDQVPGRVSHLVGSLS